MTTKSKLTELTEQKIAQKLPTMSREAIKWLRERVSELKDASRRIPKEISKEEERYIRNFGKGKISEDMEKLDEKNVPTSPEKWAQAKAQAKAKFDVYPSAYANGYAIQVCKGKIKGLDGKKRCSPPYC